jgi:hypothetical protein
VSRARALLVVALAAGALCASSALAAAAEPVSAPVPPASPEPAPPEPPPEPEGPPPPAVPLWTATHEGGDLSEWLDWSTAPDAPQADAGQAHSGSYSARLALPTGAGAIRLARDTVSDGGALPDSAYYSAWFLLPRRYEVPEWWNVLQWKTAHALSPGGSDPTYTVNVANRPDGEMFLYLYRHVGADCAYDPGGLGGAGVAAESPAALPVGRWFEVVARYDWATGPTGRVTVWQDGAPVMDVAAACTEYADALERGRQWSVNNYTLPGVVPPPAEIWVDDAAISVPSHESPVP